MKIISYANGVGNIMYEMMCSRLELAHVVSMFMTNFGCVSFEVGVEIYKLSSIFWSSDEKIWRAEPF